MKTGPNNARCIIWAISKFYIYFILCLINTNKYIKVLFVFKGFREAVAEEMGPNDARHVVWVISKFLFFLSCLINSNNYI